MSDQQQPSQVFQARGPRYVVKIRYELARITGVGPQGAPIVGGVVNVEEQAEGDSYADAYAVAKGNLRPTVEAYGLESNILVMPVRN